MILHEIVQNKEEPNKTLFIYSVTVREALLNYPPNVEVVNKVYMFSSNAGGVFW